MAEHMLKVGRVWHFKRRVPAHLAELDPRGVIQRSTRKSTLADAVPIAQRFNAELERFWASLHGSDRGTNRCRLWSPTRRPVNRHKPSASRMRQ